MRVNLIADHIPLGNGESADAQSLAWVLARETTDGISHDLGFDDIGGAAAPFVTTCGRPVKHDA